MMIIFRALLVGIFLVLGSYTVMVGSAHGWNLLAVFFGDMAAMNWPGQFNLDFMFMLTLSGLWVAWRHRFSARGLVLGVLAALLGALFLSVYLLVESFRTRGDVPALLLGRSERA